MKKSSSPNKLLITVLVLLFVGLAGASTYLFLENRDLKDQITLTTEEKNRRLVEEINQVFDLPEEEPVVAIVTDVEEFKNQYAVFDNAEQGDYLLFFRKARLNVLYRQSEKRVVKTADVVVPVAVELIGSQKAVDAAERSLADFGNQVTVTKKITDDVSQSFVFDVDDDQADEASSIASLLNIDVGATLPSSIEPADQTEIIIVVADAESSSADDSDSESGEQE